MPNNWKKYKLGEVANLVTGFAFKSKFYENDGDLRVIRGKNITEGYLRWGDDVRFWNHSLEKLERYTVQEDDIVIGMDGSKIGKNRAIIRKHDLPAILAQRVAMVRAKEGRAEQKYLWQLINNGPFENYVENVKTGTSIPHISLGQVGNFEIVLPSLPEQQAIAAILSSLDDKIELNLQMNKTLEEMAMTLYKHWFVDFGPFQDGEFVESELGLIPEGWEVKILNELISKLGDGLHGTPKYTVNGEYYFINGNNLSNGRILLKPDTKKVSKEEYIKYKKELNDRTLLISINGTIGNVAAYGGEKIMLGKSACYFNIKDDVSKGYIKQVISSNYFMDYLESNFTGSVIKNVSLKSMRELPIITPPSEIQYEFQTLITPLELQQDQLYLENQTLTTFRDTLLPKLISGEVRVKEAEQSLASIM
uniref:restriction endonuclease subunit S n=1 Tax=Roseivirga sp. TaxID=1964215 RepID=UPI0040485ACF